MSKQTLGNKDCDEDLPCITIRTVPTPRLPSLNLFLGKRRGLPLFIKKIVRDKSHQHRTSRNRKGSRRTDVVGTILLQRGLPSSTFGDTGPSLGWTIRPVNRGERRYVLRSWHGTGVSIVGTLQVEHGCPWHLMYKRKFFSLLSRTRKGTKHVKYTSTQT